MTIEDKAKAYDGALERAKKLHGKYCINNVLESLFPELKESEDEKIRKEIINYFKCQSRDEPSRKNIHNKWIVWLEKQGEQKLLIEKLPEEMKTIGKSLGFTTQEESDKYNQMVSDLIMSDGNKGEQKVSYSTIVETGDGGINALVTKELPTNGCDDEQNHSDKIELKVGDWVVRKDGESFSNGNHYAQITVIDKEQYWFDSGTWLETKDIRLWSIKDAKDGDVLYSLDSYQPFIYKERKSHEQAIAYCGINKYDKFFVWNTKDCIIVLDEYVPATKEQRDLLFEKMHESGYEWDSEKKELKNIHVIDEGKSEIDYCFTKMMNGEKVSPSWGEDDEEMLKSIMATCELAEQERDSSPARHLLEMQINWLKSIKQRIRE